MFLRKRKLWNGRWYFSDSSVWWKLLFLVLQVVCAWKISRFSGGVENYTELTTAMVFTQAALTEIRYGREKVEKFRAQSLRKTKSMNWNFDRYFWLPSSCSIIFFSNFGSWRCLAKNIWGYCCALGGANRGPKRETFFMVTGALDRTKAKKKFVSFLVFILVVIEKTRVRIKGWVGLGLVGLCDLDLRVYVRVLGSGLGF